MTEYTAKKVILKDANNNYLIPFTESELPPQTLQNGKILSTDGVNPQWVNAPSGNNLFDFKWADYSLGDESWIRSDSFSWQDGTVYADAYNHLVNDQNERTAETETIGDYTITFYRGTDGHKICLADQETTVANIFNSTKIAWYYILDTTNKRFKLPRTQYDFNGYRNKVGNYIALDILLPNITGQTGSGGSGSGSLCTGAFYQSGTQSGEAGGGGGTDDKILMSAARCSSVYSGSDTNKRIQPPATQMYLYFYVGEFSQSATEQTAGLNNELFNQKVDLSSLATIIPVIKMYVSGASGYNIWANGYCEQWGQTLTANQTVTFVKKFKSVPNMTWGFVTKRGAASYDGEIFFRSVTATNFISGNRLSDGVSPGFMWRAHGYLESGEY